MSITTLNNLESELKKLEKSSLDVYAKGFIRGRWASEDFAQQFYDCHADALKIKAKISAIKDELRDAKVNNTPTETAYATELKERRAIKEANVTSLSHERARRRLTKQADGFISH
ncbi:hypothetical protein L1267_23395 [Pseudoalteromonas sp. OFAV1]|jgi:hypothetical protein|uniref:hypothetical protein n=1 Tax=Pseudoalteromonas sp. OFAV1 TaxID=2908892 RepID=UPI001F1CBB53|nr:hypothetical protein [Pseudoalteromonas sp. OFAV1]MCF2903317.1 hypothetical protein [Pseudoalteromonas sp. OFAV1]